VQATNPPGEVGLPTAQIVTDDSHQHCPSCTCFPESPDLPKIKASERWYTVSVGRQVGVFHDWYVAIELYINVLTGLVTRHSVLPLVTGVSGACYQRHTSQKAAEEAFTAAKKIGAVAVVIS
jgi:hypothetical protein